MGSGGGMRSRRAQGAPSFVSWKSPYHTHALLSLAQISSPKGEVVITNDGATILKQMQVAHPTAKMLVDLSKSQDVEAGDGTTSVTVIAGSLLNQAQILLEKGIHPAVISESFLLAARTSEEILKVRAQELTRPSVQLASPRLGLTRRAAVFPRGRICPCRST